MHSHTQHTDHATAANCSLTPSPHIYSSSPSLHTHTHKHKHTQGKPTASADRHLVSTSWGQHSRVSGVRQQEVHCCVSLLPPTPHSHCHLVTLLARIHHMFTLSRTCVLSQGGPHGRQERGPVHTPTHSAHALHLHPLSSRLLPTTPRATVTRPCASQSQPPAPSPVRNDQVVLEHGCRRCCCCCRPDC